jgi:hypothetical protein
VPILGWARVSSDLGGRPYDCAATVARVGLNGPLAPGPAFMGAGLAIAGLAAVLNRRCVPSGSVWQNDGSYIVWRGPSTLRRSGP